MKKLIIIINFIFCFFSLQILSQCEKLDVSRINKIQTMPFDNNDFEGSRAELKAKVIDIGDNPVVDFGFFYDTATPVNPYVAHKIIKGYSNDFPKQRWIIFSEFTDTLSVNKKYFFAAYLFNGQDFVMSNEQNFTTPNAW